MEGDTLPIGKAKAGTRKRSRKEAQARAVEEERITLNLTISRKARMILHLHQDHYRGTPRGTASGLVESLILAHLRLFRVSDHSGGAAEPAAESA